MKFKYAEELGKFPDCPPETSSPVYSLAFRFSHSPILPSDFEPRIIVLPNRPQQCGTWGLSCFKTLDAAKKTHAKFSPSIKHKIGTHLVSGNLVPDDGLAEPENATGHFNFYEFRGSHLTSKFSLIEELS